MVSKRVSLYRLVEGVYRKLSGLGDYGGIDMLSMEVGQKMNMEVRTGLWRSG